MIPVNAGGGSPSIPEAKERVGGGNIRTLARKTMHRGELPVLFQGIPPVALYILWNHLLATGTPSCDLRRLHSSVTG